MYMDCQQDCDRAYDKKDCVAKCMEKGGPMMAPMEEGCGDHAEDGGMEMMVMGDEQAPEDDVEGLAGELLSLAHRIGDALGVGSDVTSMGDDDEDLEERRARGRKGPSTRQDDPRLRESVAKMHRAGYSKKQIKEFLTKAYSKALRS
jgi:microsomal dipeptidase-like Zn-dependent dipeptidase